MGHTGCVLGLSLLNILLYCGHAQEVFLSIEPNRSTLFPGETVTFICNMRGAEDTDWYYSIMKDGSTFFDYHSEKRFILQSLTTGYSGEYQCVATKSSSPVIKGRNKVSLTVSVTNRAVVTLQHDWPEIYSGETITLTCDIKDGGDAEWEYEWTPSSYTPQNPRGSMIRPSHSGDYWCKGRLKDGTYSTGWSDTFSLKVSGRPKARLSKDSPVEGRVRLTCSVGSSSSSSSSSSGWKYFLYRGETSSEPLNTPDVTVLSTGQIRVTRVGGVYWCRGGRGGRGDPVYYTEFSDPVVANRAVVTLQRDWPEIYSGETITLTCDIEDGGDAEWEYEWGTPRAYRPQYPRGSMIRTSRSGDYWCKGRLKDGTSYTGWSDTYTLKVSKRPEARLRKDSPVEGRVRLTCSVGSSSSSSSSSSSGWNYFWYRGETSSEPLNTPEVTVLSIEQISVTRGGRGVYRCRGGRGDPVYYTEFSDPVVTNRAVVTLQPDWPEIYSGETITLTCNIKDGGDAEWEYRWGTPRAYTPQNPRGSMIRTSHSGDYRCKGRLKDGTSYTDLSDGVTLRVSDKPQPVLTVSPLWLSPGDSVTLTCSVKHPSAGWRFFWYKAVPKLSHHYSYSHELLPGSTNGTEQDSYIVHGQTHTAGYVCRAGRGDPVFYTRYSELKFIWSGDVHSAASLTVSPDRVQHFSKDSPSLSCEGNSTEWRVSRFYGSGSLTYCPFWGTMTGSTCNMSSSWLSGVYWCESETQFSNAANITKQNGDVLLVSPVRPVTEGHSVTLGCKLETENVLHDVDFYKNGKLIPNHTRGELFISAVTKSDEGFYKCSGRYSTQGLRSLTSAESWLSVKYSEDTASSSSFPVLLVVGLLCGVLLIILLLLFLYRCRKSTDSSVMRSQSTNQSPATDHVTQDRENASPLHGDSVLYASVKGSEESEHDESRLTYSVVELRNIPKKRKNKEPDESAVYSYVKTASAADDNLLYAQVHPRTKDKKAKGKSRSAAAEETLYSEVKPGARDH